MKKRLVDILACPIDKGYPLELHVFEETEEIASGIITCYNALIRRAEVDNTIIVGDSKIECSKRIVDSLIGRNAHISDSANNLDGSRFIIGENTLICL